MEEQRAWIQSRRRKRLRITAVILSICVLMTNYPDIWGTLSALAEETQDGDGMVYVSDFAGLPEEVREQAVPVGTGIEELMLPDALEAFAAAAKEEDDPGDTEQKEKEETDGVTEEPGDTGQEGTVQDAAQEIGDDYTEETEDTDQTEDAKLTQETYTVTMPEYQAGNVITVETLENTQETGTKEETVTIEGITWQPETAYDGNTEGTYLFTAVLPEGYALMEGVSLPQITVTVQADSADSVIQALLERIAALPDAEEYLAKEPDTEEEEAYVEWMEGLHQYAGGSPRHTGSL